MATAKATAKKAQVGKKVPAFTVAVSGGGTLKLSDLKGKNIVFYFYPKDNTSGCTREGQEFAKLAPLFKKRNTVILGVSRDSVASHDKFIAKYDFPFQLASDEDERLCRLFDVIKMKSLYGRQFLGVVRSTFVVDADGVLVKEWRNIKVPGHVETVLEFIKENL